MLWPLTVRFQMQATRRNNALYNAQIAETEAALAGALDELDVETCCAQLEHLAL